LGLGITDLGSHTDECLFAWRRAHPNPSSCRGVRVIDSSFVFWVSDERCSGVAVWWVLGVGWAGLGSSNDHVSHAPPPSHTVCSRTRRVSSQSMSQFQLVLVLVECLVWEVCCLRWASDANLVGGGVNLNISACELHHHRPSFGLVVVSSV
jgi:hypothetical protein